MPIFARIMLNLNFRHRSLQRYRSHQRNSLSSEIQLFKVGRISKNPGKFPDPGQLFMKITVKVFIHKDICIVSDTIFGVKLIFVTRDIGAEYELGLRIWSA